MYAGRVEKGPPVVGEQVGGISLDQYLAAPEHRLGWVRAPMELLCYFIERECYF
jgi:hypothetical protein